MEKYLYHTHKIYNDLETAVQDFMKVYNCTYEQAKEFVPKDLFDVSTREKFYIDESPVKETKYESICVFDICDRYEGYWCDYYFDDNTTYFGGSGWYKVPPLKTDYIPTDKEACEYADKYMRSLKKEDN